MCMLRNRASALILAILVSAAAVAAESTNPWTPSDLITAPQLNSELPEVKSGKIILIHVGFLTMYKMGHIPGSRYAGPAARPDGLAALRKLASKYGRHQQIVIYCGCCPWNDCPNIRPAFRALKQMGFVNLKVLYIPKRLGKDWTAKGYPTVTGD